MFLLSYIKGWQHTKKEKRTQNKRLLTHNIGKRVEKQVCLTSKCMFVFFFTQKLDIYPKEITENMYNYLSRRMPIITMLFVNRKILETIYMSTTRKLLITVHP